MSILQQSHLKFSSVLLFDDTFLAITKKNVSIYIHEKGKEYQNLSTIKHI